LLSDIFLILRGLGVEVGYYTECFPGSGQVRVFSRSAQFRSAGDFQTAHTARDIDSFRGRKRLHNDVKAAVGQAAVRDGIPRCVARHGGILVNMVQVFLLGRDYGNLFVIWACRAWRKIGADVPLQ